LLITAAFLLHKVNENRGCQRVQYPVFTKPKYAPGALLQGQQEVFCDFDQWRKAYPMMQRCLVVQEDRSSQYGDSRLRVVKATALNTIAACIGLGLHLHAYFTPQYDTVQIHLMRCIIINT
jgi:hypothetical protein